MGDGSGGGLALRFVQSLVEEQQPVPSKLFLISPLLDATLSNKDITEELEDKDILVSRFGVNELMKAWSNGLPLTDKRVSPLYGELKGLPPVYMYGGGKEIGNPDMKLFAHLLEDNGQYIDFKEYPKMVHDFRFILLDNRIKSLNKLQKQYNNKTGLWRWFKLPKSLFIILFND